MEPNKKVVVFVLLAVSVMGVLSAADFFYRKQFPLLEKISLTADVIHINEAASAPHAPAALTGLPHDSVAAANGVPPQPKTLGEYMQPGQLINFTQDHTQPVLPLLMAKLMAIDTGAKKKIRIAWLGDSIIEGDLLTQTFRRRMQRFFGGSGVGFVPFRSVSADFRQTVSCNTTGEWTDESFKKATEGARLHLCGHQFSTAGGSVKIKDFTTSDSNAFIEKAIICGYNDSVTEIEVNGQPRQIAARQVLNRIVLDASTSKELSLTIKDQKLPLYGISMETAKGVIVDNFSFRGIAGSELKKLNTSFLQSLEQNNPYDLVVLEYGTNLMFRPNDVDYSYYYNMMSPVLRNLRRAMPNTEFLIISSADRAFKYDAGWKTAIGIDSLLQVQARLAYENGMAFYNLYQSMGGSGTIVRWADSAVSFANKDYIHPNHRGAEVLGNMLADAFIKDYKKLSDKNRKPTTKTKS